MRNHNMVMFHSAEEALAAAAGGTSEPDSPSSGSDSDEQPQHDVRHLPRTRSLSVHMRDHNMVAFSSAEEALAAASPDSQERAMGARQQDPH